jgi:hypothetical protein
LEKAGCSFKKKPDEGRMKGLAFVYDPGKRLVVAAGLELLVTLLSYLSSKPFLCVCVCVCVCCFAIDSYWVEIVKRGEKSGIKNELNFSQTMLRVKVSVYEIDMCRVSLVSSLRNNHILIESFYPPFRTLKSRWNFIRNWG